MPPAMNQLREAVSIPVESRMSPRTPRRSSRSPQTEHKPNAMNPAYMLTMARPIASNLSAVPSDASPQLRPSCTRALNRAADAPAHPLAISGAGPGLQLPGRTGEPVGRPGSASPPTDNGFELRLCRRTGRCCQRDVRLGQPGGAGPAPGNQHGSRIWERRKRTRMASGVGAGRAVSPATRLGHSFGFLAIPLFQSTSVAR